MILANNLSLNNFINECVEPISERKDLDAKPAVIIQQDRPQEAREHPSFLGFEANKSNM